MKELKKGLDISLKGPQAVRALARLRTQCRKWKLAMPPVEPLVLDFGLDEFERTGLIEYWIANEGEAGYCGKYLFVLRGQTCPKHRHKGKHETFFIVKGSVRMESRRRAWVMKEGDIFPVPRGCYHRFTGMEPALLLEISTPCEIDDNYFENPAIPIGGNARGSGRRR